MDAKAVKITYGLATDRVGAWIKAYKSTDESPRGEEGSVNGNPVEVREGGGVFVKVQVGVDEIFCKENCVLSF
jgi:hypothetical protein